MNLKLLVADGFFMRLEYTTFLSIYSVTTARSKRMKMDRDQEFQLLFFRSKTSTILVNAEPWIRVIEYVTGATAWACGAICCWIGVWIGCTAGICGAAW